MKNKKRLTMVIVSVGMLIMGAFGGVVIFAATFDPNFDLGVIHDTITKLGELNDSKKERIVQLEDQVNQVQSDKQAIQQQLETQKNQLEQEVNKRGDLENQVKDLENKLLDAQNKENSLLQEIQSLKDAAADKKSIQEKYDDLAEKVNAEATYAQQVLAKANQ